MTTTTKSQKEGKSIQFVRKLNHMMCARATIWVVTQEEERFLKLFRKIAVLNRGEGDTLDKNYGVFSWSVTEGVLNLLPSMISENGVYRNPIMMTETRVDKNSLQAQFGSAAPKPEAMPVKTFPELYDFIKKDCQKRVFILKDVHNLLEKSGANYATTLRSIKDIIYHVRINDGYLIFLSPSARIPIDIENDVQIYDMPRPDDIDISELIDNALSDIADIKPDFKLDINYTNSQGKLIKSKHPDAENIRERIIMNLRGLTESEISQILAYNCVKNKGLEESAITEIKDAKRQVIEKSGSLKFISVPKTVNVGGHDAFKKYIEERGLYLNKKIRDAYNLAAPKGTLMVGVSGCQPAGSKVLMAGGTWKNIEDIVVGDKVSSPQLDNTVIHSSIVSIANYENQDIYEIKHNKGGSYLASGEHILPVYKRKTETGKTHKTRKQFKAYDNMTVNQFNAVKKSYQSIYNIYTTPAYDLPEIDHIIHPYLMGAILGDGCIYSAGPKDYMNISFTYANKNKNVFEKLAAHASFGNPFFKKGTDNLQVYMKKYGKEFNKFVEYFPYATNSHAKFIPEEYKIGSLQQRLELLSGLIDTDGSPHSYTSVSSQLIQDFYDLVHSVGGYCSKPKERYTKSCKDSDKKFKSYRVEFSFAEHRPELQIEHKNQTSRNMEWKNPRNHGFATELVGNGTVYGFDLDSPSKHYITDDYIVTHNSGKSLLAKYVGYQWNVPLIRLNMDSVFGKYLGESEDNLRVALAIAEANAPCVLWIDELEKALGGTGTSGDSGTGLRILGKILTWMQEREEMIFMFATANAVAKLPPELQRAGRFDAKFWADLPSIHECKDIFEIKAKENGFELKDDEYASLGRRAFEKQMTGAEIEHAVIQGVYAAAVQASKTDKIELVTKDFVHSAVEEIHSHASSHQAELLKDRTKALEDYTFTSNESRNRIEQEIKGVVTRI